MSAAVDRLVAVVEALRDHCPWTAALTPPELTSYLLEEAHEAVAEIESHDAAGWADVAARRSDGSYAALAGELGDVLFQVVLHAAVSRAPGAPRGQAGFSVDDAAEALTAKLIRRNPLVLTPAGELRPAEELAVLTPEAVELAWERVKEAERAGRAGTVGAAGPSGAVGEGAGSGEGSAGPTVTGGAPDPFGGIPDSLPALAAASLVVDRAARQDPDPVAQALGQVAAASDGWADEDELGTELFSLVRRARAAGLDPERALRRGIARLRRR